MCWVIPGPPNELGSLLLGHVCTSVRPGGSQVKGHPLERRDSHTAGVRAGKSEEFHGWLFPQATAKQTLWKGGLRWAGLDPPPGLPENTLWSGSIPNPQALVRQVTPGLGEPKPQVGSLRGAPHGLRVASPLHRLRKPFLFHCSRPAASQPRPPLTSLCLRTRSLHPSPAPASGSRPTPRLSMLQPLSSLGRSLPPTHHNTGVD